MRNFFCLFICLEGHIRLKSFFNAQSKTPACAGFFKARASALIQHTVKLLSHLKLVTLCVSRYLVTLQ